MRQIVLDTETTGLNPAEGHRLIEIGAIEIIDRRITGRYFHTYLQPDREIDTGAQQVHGITMEKLAHSPRFRDIVNEFLDYIRNAELIIHNAPFDTGFINHELGLLNATWGTVNRYCTILDTLEMARKLHPGQRNSLDALCKRYQIDNSKRDLHGALIDADLLARVYLAMTGGQAELLLVTTQSPDSGVSTKILTGKTHPPLRLIYPSAEESAAHQQRLADIQKQSGGGCLWVKLTEAN